MRFHSNCCGRILFSGVKRYVFLIKNFVSGDYRIGDFAGTQIEIETYALNRRDQIDRRRGGLKLDIRDDPLMGHDEYRLLAAPADTDVTSRYATP